MKIKEKFMKRIKGFGEHSPISDFHKNVFNQLMDEFKKDIESMKKDITVGSVHNTSYNMALNAVIESI